jgi:hypothetical protein
VVVVLGLNSALTADVGAQSEASEFPFPGAIELRDDRQQCRTRFKPFRLIQKAPTPGEWTGFYRLSFV